MPLFSPLNQEFSQLSPGCTMCAALPRAGAVSTGTTLCLVQSGEVFLLRKRFLNDAFTPIVVLTNHWACVYFVISSLLLTDFLFLIMYNFPNYRIQQGLPGHSNIITKLSQSWSSSFSSSFFFNLNVLFFKTVDDFGIQGSETVQIVEQVSKPHMPIWYSEFFRRLRLEQMISILLCHRLQCCHFGLEISSTVALLWRRKSANFSYSFFP